MLKSREEVLRILNDLKRFRTINESDIDGFVDTLMTRVKNIKDRPELSDLQNQLKEAEAVIRVATNAYQIGQEVHNYYTNKMRKAGLVE